MANLVLLILGRTAFVGLLVVIALAGLVSLVGYPGPAILTAFSLGGLPVWVLVRRWLWVVALSLSMVACVLPMGLLIRYTSDGDFTVPSLIAQVIILGLIAYGLAWFGIAAGRFVWLPPENRVP